MSGELSDTKFGLQPARALEHLYLELWPEVAPGRGFTAPGRQVLHTTFGSVLNHPEFGPAVRAVLEDHPQTGVIPWYGSVRLPLRPAW